MNLSKKLLIFSLLSLLTLSGCGFNGAVKKVGIQIVWKDYCSSDFGIEFKYPADWSLRNENGALYLYEGGVSGRIGIMSGGSFSEVENSKNNVASSEIINLAGTRVLKRIYLPTDHKNIIASEGYYFFVPQDKYVAVINYYSDRNKDILDTIANSLKFVGDNGCFTAGDNGIAVGLATTTNIVSNNEKEVATSSVVGTPGLISYENKILGYKLEYPADYKIINTNSEGVKAGVVFYNSKIENAPFKTSIDLFDQNFMLLLSKWNIGDVVVFYFGKEKINKVLDLKKNSLFASGTVETINNTEFFRLSGSDRAYYIVKNPNNNKFLVFEIYFPKEYKKDFNDEKIKNLNSMLKTLSFE